MAESQCSGYPDVPCRINLDLMPEPTYFWMIGLTALAVAIFGYGIWQMIHVWRMGRSWKPADWKVGLKRLVSALGTHRKFKREMLPDGKDKSGSNHSWVFFGMVVLFIGTTLAAIDMDLFELVLEAKLLEGTGYLWYEAILDLGGLVFILGLIYMILRRYRQKPDHVHGHKHVELPFLNKMDGDLYALVFLLAIGVTGFLMEGIRLQAQIARDGITYAQWSFVGHPVGFGLSKIASVETLVGFYPMLWWIHFALWSSVLAILPWTKLKHIVSSSLNIFFHDPEREARASLSKPFDLAEIMESGDYDAMGQVGYTTIRDLTWKDRLALDACTNCGRCESQCPANAAGRPLSPRKLIQDMKEVMWEDYRAGKAHSGDEEYVPMRLVENGDVKIALDEATLWSCTTCRACMTECPVDIHHVDLIAEMRRGLVMESKVDEHQGKLIMNLTNAKNPYGFPMADRADWTNGLPDGVEVPLASAKAASGQSFEYLWWVGCVGSYDHRNQQVTQDIAKIFNAAGLDFAILGTEEQCNGDPARRLGEEGLFQQAVMENMMILENYGVKKIVAQCPHCFNTFANEYPEFGAKFEVIHHTQLIEQLIEEGRLPLRNNAEMTVTYHDSCYLGRHNDIFDAPRRVLQANGLPVLEMAQSGDQGLCCGAGGSNMWYEVKEESERINVIRAKQAADTGAEAVVSNCPFCLTMLKDGLTLTGNAVEEGGRMVAQDLAEIVAANLDVAGPPVALDAGGDSERESVPVVVGKDEEE